MRSGLTIGMVLLAVNALAQAPAAPAARATAAAPATAQGRTAAATPKASRGYDDAIVRTRALLKESKFKEALEASEQAIALDDKRWEAYVTAASAYSTQGLFDDAIGMLQSALTRAPDDRKPLIRDALAETRRALSAPLPQAATANTAAPAASAPTQGEIVLWKSIENSKNAPDFSGYLEAYPAGLYAPLAKSRLAALTESARTPQQRAAEIVAKIVALSNNVKAGDGTQNVFAAGCLLSVVIARQAKDGGPSSSTIDLRQSNEGNLRVESTSTSSWEVTGLFAGVFTGTGQPTRNGVLFADQVSVSQLFPLLAEAIPICKAAYATDGADDLKRPSTDGGRGGGAVGGRIGGRGVKQP